jgi:hypothetical protein
MIFFASVFVFGCFTAQAQTVGTFRVVPGSGTVGTDVIISGTGWTDARYIGPLSPGFYYTVIWSENQQQLNKRIDNWMSQPDLHGIGDVWVDNNGAFTLSTTVPSSPSGRVYFYLAHENPSTGYLYGIYAGQEFTVGSSAGSGGFPAAWLATYTGFAGLVAAAVMAVPSQVQRYRERVRRRKEELRGGTRKKEDSVSTSTVSRSPTDMSSVEPSELSLGEKLETRGILETQEASNFVIDELIAFFDPSRLGQGVGDLSSVIERWGTEGVPENWMTDLARMLKDLMLDITRLPVAIAAAEWLVLRGPGALKAAGGYLKDVAADVTTSIPSIAAQQARELSQMRVGVIRFLRDKGVPEEAIRNMSPKLIDDINACKDQEWFQNSLRVTQQHVEGVDRTLLDLETKGPLHSQTEYGVAQDQIPDSRVKLDGKQVQIQNMGKEDPRFSWLAQSGKFPKTDEEWEVFRREYNSELGERIGESIDNIDQMKKWLKNTQAAHSEVPHHWDLSASSTPDDVIERNADYMHSATNTGAGCEKAEMEGKTPITLQEFTQRHTASIDSGVPQIKADVGVPAARPDVQFIGSQAVVHQELYVRTGDPRFLDLAREAKKDLGEAMQAVKDGSHSQGPVPQTYKWLGHAAARDGLEGVGF